jgi:hypothetical protein
MLEGKKGRNKFLILLTDLSYCFMKKCTTLIIILLLTVATTTAQEFRRFKVGVGVGYAGENFNNLGGLFFMEPAYRITNLLLVGVRAETSFLSETFSATSEGVTRQSTTVTSFTLNTQYYFSEYYARPFIGIGAGVFSHSGIEYHAGEVLRTTPYRSSIGFYPRVGVDIGHLTLTVDYNIIPSSDDAHGLNNYLGIRAAIALGGGVGQRKPFNSY